MRLRRTSERRPPLSYQGDGTYSNLFSSELEHAPSIPVENDDGATILISSPRLERAHDGIASNCKRPPSAFPAAFGLSHRPALPHSNAITTAHIPGMANIKYIRPHGRPAPPPRDSVPKKRQSRTERSVTVESNALTASTEPPPRRPCARIVTLDMADGKPAVFPCYGPDEGAREAPAGRHGIVRLLKERSHAQWDTLDASRLRVDRMYEGKRFPSAMSLKERKWYSELKDRMTSAEGKAKLNTFFGAFGIKRTFHDLWPSLRQTIIDEIRDETHGIYKSEYWPVLCLLGLAQSELVDILHENNQIWDCEAEIPQHLLQLKRKYPDQPVDPDTPPPSEIMNAILYLKQEHLPASLLGEWQFPMPDFDLPTKPIAQPAEDTRAKEAKTTMTPAAAPMRVLPAPLATTPARLRAASQVALPKPHPSIPTPTILARPPITPPATLPAGITLPPMNSSLGKALNDRLQHELRIGTSREQKQKDYTARPTDTQAGHRPKSSEVADERSKLPQKGPFAENGADEAVQSFVHNPGNTPHSTTPQTSSSRSGPSLAPPPNFLLQNTAQPSSMSKNPVVGHFAAPVVRNQGQYRPTTPTNAGLASQNQYASSATQFLKQLRADQEKYQNTGLKTGGLNGSLWPADSANKTSPQTQQEHQKKTSTAPNMARVLEKHYQLLYSSPNPAKSRQSSDSRSLSFSSQGANQSPSAPKQQGQTQQANSVSTASPVQRPRSDSVTRPSSALSTERTKQDLMASMLEESEKALSRVPSPDMQFRPNFPQLDATASLSGVPVSPTSYREWLQHQVVANRLRGGGVDASPSAGHYYLPQHYAPPMTPPQQIVGNYARDTESPNQMTMLSNGTGSGLSGSMLSQQYQSLRQSAGSPQADFNASFEPRASPLQDQIFPPQGVTGSNHSPPQIVVSSSSGSPHNDPRLQTSHPAQPPLPSNSNNQNADTTPYRSALHPAYRYMGSPGDMGPYYFHAGSDMRPYLPHQSPYGAYPAISPPSSKENPPSQHPYPQQRPPPQQPRQKTGLSEASLDPRLLADLREFGGKSGSMGIAPYAETAPTNSVLEDMRVNVNSVLEVNSLLPPRDRKRTADRMMEGESGAKRVAKRMMEGEGGAKRVAKKARQ